MTFPYINQCSLKLVFVRFHKTNIILTFFDIGGEEFVCHITGVGERLM